MLSVKIAFIHCYQTNLLLKALAAETFKPSVWPMNSARPKHVSRYSFWLVSPHKVYLEVCEPVASSAAYVSRSLARSNMAARRCISLFPIVNVVSQLRAKDSPGASGVALHAGSPAAPSGVSDAR